MTFADWMRDSGYRFKTQSPRKAARECGMAFLRGAIRRLEPSVIPTMWGRGDWDVLVVLDACRVDQMEAVIDEYDALPDTVESVVSTDTCSIDWIETHFNDHYRKAMHAGYVTANPFADHNTNSSQSADLSENGLPLFLPLYRTHWQDITPSGSRAEELERETGRAKVGSGIATVPPEAVTEHAIAAWRQRHQLGLNRLVAHYMQPHEPYRSHPEWGSGDRKLLENMVTDGEAQAGSSIWPRVEAGEIPKSELWEAGVDNLRWVLDDVTERLLPNVDGDVVLTADHGNAMGEWGEWHHPPGAIAPSVRKVPWVRVSATDQCTVQPDVDLQTGEDEADTDVEEQLAALGYAE